MDDMYLIPGKPPRPLFPVGILVITTNAARTLNREDVAEAMSRHFAGDWGDLDEDDIIENEVSLLAGYRLLSAYHDRNRVKFWIITERDRSATTVLLPEDY